MTSGGFRIVSDTLARIRFKVLNYSADVQATSSNTRPTARPRPVFQLRQLMRVVALPLVDCDCRADKSRLVSRRLRRASLLQSFAARIVSCNIAIPTVLTGYVPQSRWRYTARHRRCSSLLIDHSVTYIALAVYTPCSETSPFFFPVV